MIFRMKNLIEPFAVPEYFVSGIGMIEELPGPCFRFTMFSMGMIDSAVEACPIVQYKAIIPATSIASILDQYGMIIAQVARLSPEQIIRAVVAH